MDQRPAQRRMVFRIGAGTLCALGFWALFFCTLGVLILIRRSNPAYLEGAVAVFAPIFLLTSYVRLEMREDGFTCRSFGLNESIQYDDIALGYFEIMHSEYCPQGIAFFRLRLRDGTPIKFNLNVFSVRVGAILFAALESRGIPINTVDHWAVRSIMKRIRKTQLKLGLQPPSGNLIFLTEAS